MVSANSVMNSIIGSCACQGDIPPNRFHVIYLVASGATAVENYNFPESNETQTLQRAKARSQH